MLVVSHTARAEAIAATQTVVSSLQQHGVTVAMTETDRDEYTPHLDVSQVVTLGREVAVADIEVTIVLGGDGTILRAAEEVRGSRCPIASVNLGHVGFLAEMEPHALDTTIDRVLARDYTVEERTTLDVRIIRSEHTVAHTFAVNEATVEKQQRMIEVSVGVDGQPLSTFGCDGMVMSTPTGSTAYAFSAGGPIMWPQVDAMLMVPIAAHALFNRPLVVGPQSVLETQLTLNTPGTAYLWCDGRRRFELHPGDRVEVRSSPRTLRLARMYQGEFSERLVQKFHLPVEGWRGEKPGS